LAGQAELIKTQAVLIERLRDEVAELKLTFRTSAL
jgi:hypothetical protein